MCIVINQIIEARLLLLKLGTFLPDFVQNEKNTFNKVINVFLNITIKGNSVEEANKRYDFLTTGKGRNRKVINAEIQTVPILFKTRQTEKERVTNKSSYAFASGWDMFDTYSKTQAPDDEKEDKEFELIEAKKSVDSLAHSKEDKQFQKIVHNPHFFEACIVIERLLANNNFNAEQKRFRGLSDPEPFREDIEYKYRLNLLWTFSTEKTQGDLCALINSQHP